MSKSFLRISAILAFLFATLTSAVLLPAFRLIGTDFVLSGTLLYDAVDLLWQWLEIFLLCLLVALVLLGVHRAGLSGARPVYFISGGALLFKYIAAIVSSAIMAGSLDLTINYGTTVFSFFLELLMLAAVAYFTHRITTAHHEQTLEKQNAAGRLHTEPPQDAPLLPFARPFTRKNALQSVLYLGIGIVTFFRAASFVASEIAFTMMGYAFFWSDLPVTLLYLLLTVLAPCFLAYLGAYFLVNTLFLRYLQAE